MEDYLVLLHIQILTNNHFLYVYYTYVENDQLLNKVQRITESENQLIDAKTILEKIPGSKFSNGGVIKFGPDNKLYVATGAGSDSSHNAQDLESLAGKVLRLNDDGSIPDDNPFSNSPVYSYGHSNPRGMAWDNLEIYTSQKLVQQKTMKSI